VYRVETDEQAQQQINQLPAHALAPYAELRILLEVGPWSGEWALSGALQGGHSEEGLLLPQRGVCLATRERSSIFSGGYGAAGVVAANTRVAEDALLIRPSVFCVGACGVPRCAECPARALLGLLGHGVRMLPHQVVEQERQAAGIRLWVSVGAEPVIQLM
jgi:hypothetical protein